MIYLVTQMFSYSWFVLKGVLRKVKIVLGYLTFICIAILHASAENLQLPLFSNRLDEGKSYRYLPV